MASTSRSIVGRRLGVLIAGAMVATALSVATAGADPSGALILRKGRYTPASTPPPGSSPLHSTSTIAARPSAATA